MVSKRTVVVPLIGDAIHDRGLSFASALARRLDAAVRLVRADVDATEADSIEHRKTVEAARARFQASHPDIETSYALVAGADVANAIATELNSSSIVVMATNHAGTTNASASVAEALTAIWSGPVVMVGPSTVLPNFNDPIVVPLDGSPLAEAAIPIALDLAMVFDAPLWLVHVVDAATRATTDALRDGGKPVSQSAYIQGVASDLSPQSRRIGWEIVYDDDPVAGIARFARDQHAGLIVAATHGRTDSSRLAFGSVCMELVQSGPIPVVGVHPDVSPPASIAAG